MTLTEGRKWLLFSVLLSLLLLSIFFQRDSSRAIKQSSTGPEEARGRSVSEVEVPTLDLLANRTRLNASVKRNIFQFKDVTTPEILSEARPTTPPGLTPDPAPTQPVAPDVRYLGFYQEKGSSEAKLAAISNGGQIYVGGVGETLAGKYEVLHVDDELLILRILADGKVIRFPLGKKGAIETSAPLP